MGTSEQMGVPQHDELALRDATVPNVCHLSLALCLCDLELKVIN